MIKSTYKSYITNLVSLIRENSQGVKKKKIVALITVQVHLRDLLEGLAGLKQRSFEWTKQLRFYQQNELGEKVNITIE